MAFTRKAAPKKASKPASYARKSKKVEPELEQEQLEEEAPESDYEDAPEQEEVQYEDQEPQEQEQRPSRGYSNNNYAAPTRPSGPSRGYSRPAAPASRFSRPNTAQPAQGSDSKGVRVTGFFAGKREGLLTGKLRTQDIEGLLTLLDQAAQSNQEVMFFLWENQQQPGKPILSLTANIAQPRPNNGFRRGGIGRY